MATSPSRDRDQLIELTVHGYIRTQYPHVPIEIMGVVMSFYDLMRHWWFTGAQMQHLKNQTKQLVPESILGEPFQHKGITFQCRLDFSVSENDISFMLNIIDKPKEIESVQIFGELSCAQVQSTRLFVTNSDRGASWLTDSLKFEQCQQFDELCFSSLVDVMYITYNPDCHKETYFQSVSIPTVVEYKWKICGAALKTLQGYAQKAEQSGGGWNFFDGVDSEAFGDGKWNLNLWYMDMLKLSPRLLMVPYGVHSVGVQVSTTSSLSEEVATHSCNYEIQSEGSVPVPFTAYDLDEITSAVYLTVSMEVYCLRDKDTNKIPKDQWATYGFITPSKAVTSQLY